MRIAVVIHYEAGLALKGFEFIAEAVGRIGGGTVFSMLGSTNVPWLAHGVQNGEFRLIRTRHEDTAVSAAAAYTRVSGHLGICGVTRGPGFANSVNSLAAASTGHSPLLMLVGDSPALGTTQILQQERIADAIGVGYASAGRIEDLPNVLNGAVSRCWRNGQPQVVSVSDDLLSEESHVEVEWEAIAAPEDADVNEVDRDSISHVVDLLVRSERPVILAGQGAVLSGCRPELEELGRLSGAMLANSLNATRFFSGSTADVGLCGSWSPTPVADVLSTADLVVGFGASLNSHTLADGGMFPNASIVQCEVDSEQELRASSPDLGLLGDARVIAREMLQELLDREPTPKAPPIEDCLLDKVRDWVMQRDIGHDPARGLDPRMVYRYCNDTLPAERIVVSDAGRHLRTLPTLVDASGANSWLVTRGYGSVGLGLGWAVGAASAAPDRPVVLFCGDGGLMMASHDLDAVRINGLSLTVVIMNDGGYGAEKKFLTRFGLAPDIAAVSMPDVTLLAQAYGGHCTVVRQESDLETIDWQRDGLHLVDMHLDPSADAELAL